MSADPVSLGKYRKSRTGKAPQPKRRSAKGDRTTTATHSAPPSPVDETLKDGVPFDDLQLTTGSRDSDHHRAPSGARRDGIRPASSASTPGSQRTASLADSTASARLQPSARASVDAGRTSSRNFSVRTASDYGRDRLSLSGDRVLSMPQVLLEPTDDTPVSPSPPSSDRAPSNTNPLAG